MSTAESSPKARYHVRNWPEYTSGLKARGSLTIWISEDVLEKWYSVESTGKRGRRQTYSDLAITCVLTLQAVYQLPLRAVEGLAESVFSLLGLELKCPDYSTLSRRRSKLRVDLPRVKTGQKLDLVVDSTGLKIYGEGEWKVRTHGASKRRTWRKLHIGADPDTGEILASLLTQNDVSDDQAFPDLLEQINEPLESAAGDGAYDKKGCYEALHARNATPKIPPRRDAVPQKESPGSPYYNPALAPRDEALKRIKELGGDEDARKKWKSEIGYHQRSLSETAMFRLKTIFSSSLSSRIFENQKVEAALRSRALNIMTLLGMPDSVKIT